MPTFDVYLVAVASTSVRVEAEDKEAAYDAAFDQALPYAGYGAGFELGQWEIASDLFPDTNTFDNDIVEVEA